MTRYEHLYRATGDPLYVMAAVGDYEQCPDGEPWPSWVTGSLRDMAAKLILMADEGQPARAARQVPAALGLTARGRNRFEDYRMDRRAEAALWAHEQGRAVFSEDGKQPTSNKINEWLAEAVRSGSPGATRSGKKRSGATKSAARGWLKRGRGLK